jgi:hypothetical protein
MFSPPRILRAAQDDKKGGNDPASTTKDKLDKYLYIKYIQIELKAVVIRSKGKSHVSTRHDRKGAMGMTMNKAHHSGRASACQDIQFFRIPDPPLRFYRDFPSFHIYSTRIKRVLDGLVCAGECRKVCQVQNNAGHSFR